MSTKRFRILLILLSFVSINLVSYLYIGDIVGAVDYPRLANRSLSVGSTVPGETTSYTMSWRFPSSVTLGSVRLKVCADPYVLDPCSDDTSTDLSGAGLSSQAGITNFSIASQTNNEVLLTRPPSASGTSQLTYVFDNIVNASQVYNIFYIQIFTYSSVDGSGAPSYMSSIANSINEPINITAIVPPLLYFCVGLTVDDWCEDLSGHGNFIDYGDLDPINGHSATSQFGVATNAAGGYVVTANGGTMTSGNKKIDNLEVLDGYQAGVPQFGINLRANTNPAIGADVAGAGVGVVTADYDTPDMFVYRSGDTVAQSNTGSLFNTFTTTYILNLPANQPSGVYNTTITYLCTASF